MAVRNKIKLVRSGLRLGEQTLPLLAGSVHYWRIEPADWRAVITSVKTLGLRLIDTYVPWSVHELAPGRYDFGGNPQRDVTRFLRLCKEAGLFAIVRPGPHVNAELTWFGIPERVIWDADCQARSPQGKPVVLPIPPLSFPVPSYASEAFHAEAGEWLSAISAHLAPHAWPEGPIVLVQIDNEGSLYFRDGVYDQDYHPDAISQYRRYLQKKYRRVEQLRKAHGDPSLTFAKADAPRQFDAKSALDLCVHLDWAEFQEQLLADALRRFSEVVSAAGLNGLPTCHNLPLSEVATPLDPERLGRAVDLLGLDYYHGAADHQRLEIARRTTELAARSRAQHKPAFASELGAGFPPFYPPLSEQDNEFTALTALAYGLRGFNVYMAVERDRWIGAPIDPRGRLRGSARFWKKLVSALERTRFWELRRRCPVQIVVPRSTRRLARVMHAFGPVSAALFRALGNSEEDSCFEDDLGLSGPVVVETDRFLNLLEQALEQRGVPYGRVGGDLFDVAVKQAAWTIVACPGGMETELSESVARALKSGQAVTLGPYYPDRDASFSPLPEATAVPYLPDAKVPSLLGLNPQAIERVVDQAIERLNLPMMRVEPSHVLLTVHEDRTRTPAALFVINPSEKDTLAELDLPIGLQAKDALSEEPIRSADQRISLFVDRFSVRMLELVVSS